MSEKHQSIWTSLKKPYFWSNVHHNCFLNFLLNYFLGIFNPWIAMKVKTDRVENFVTFMNTTVAMGAIFSPLAGRLLDRNRNKLVKKYLVSTMRSSARNILICDLSMILKFALS